MQDQRVFDLIGWIASIDETRAGGISLETVFEVTRPICIISLYPSPRRPCKFAVGSYQPLAQPPSKKKKVLSSVAKLISHNSTHKNSLVWITLLSLTFVLVVGHHNYADLAKRLIGSLH